MTERHWPTPSTWAIASTFSTASLFSICTITRMSWLADCRYPGLVTPHIPCVNGLPKPRLPTGGNRLSATTSLAFSTVDTWKKTLCSKPKQRIFFFFFAYQGYQNSLCTSVESMLDLPTRTRSHPCCRDPNNHCWTSIWYRSLNTCNDFGSSRYERYQSMFAIYYHPWEMGTGLRHNTCDESIWNSEPRSKCWLVSLEKPQKCVRCHGGLRSKKGQSNLALTSSCFVIWFI